MQNQKHRPPPIHWVYPNRDYSYVSHVDGHFLWDVAPEMCDSDCSCYLNEEDSETEEYTRKRQENIYGKKEKSQCSQRYNRRYYKDDDGKYDRTSKRRPWVGIHNPNVGPSRVEYMLRRVAEFLQAEERREREQQQRKRKT